MLYNSDNGQVPWILKTTWWWPSWSRDDKSRGFIILLITQLLPFFIKAGLFIAAVLLQMLLLKWFKFDHLLNFLFTRYIYVGHLLKFCLHICWSFTQICLQICAVYFHLNSDLRMICGSFTQLLWSPTRIN